MQQQQFPVFLSLFIIILCSSTLLKGQSKAAIKVQELDALYEVNYQRGDLIAAEFNLLEGIQIRKKELGREHSITLDALMKLAGFYQKTGQMEDAEHIFSDLMSKGKTVFGEEDKRYSTILYNLAVVSNDLGEYEDALEYYFMLREVSLKKYQNKVNASYAYALEGLATTCYNLSRYEEAESYYKEVLAIEAEKYNKIHPKYAFALSNLAAVYQATNRNDEAIKLIKDALYIQGKILGKMDNKYANSLNTLAVLYDKMERYADAEKIIREVISIMDKKLGKEHPWYLTAQANLVSLLIHQERYEEAERLCLEVTEKNSKLLGKKHPSHINTLGLMAKVYLKMNRNDLALLYTMKTLNAALSDGQGELSFSDVFIAKIPSLKYDYQLKINYIYAILIKVLHASYEDSKDAKWLKQRHEVIKNVIELNETFRNAFTFEKDKYTILKDVATFINEGMVSSYELAEREEDNSYMKDAFIFAEQNKSILLLDALKSRKKRNFGNLPDSLVKKENALQRHKSILQKQMLEESNSSKRSEIRSDLNDLKNKISHFKDELAKEYPRYFKTKYGRNIISNTTEEIQELLDEKTLLLEYFVADSITYLFALSKKNLEVIPLNVDRELLKENVAHFRKALSQYSFIVKEEKTAWGIYTSMAHWFYKELLAPGLANVEGIEQLIIIPDYELGHLPFEAFLVENSGDEIDYTGLHYLLNDYQVSYNYSAILWKENLAKPVHTPNGNVLACAAKYGDVDKVDVVAKRGMLMGRLRNSLNPLSAVQKEVKTLSGLFLGEFLSGEETTEAFFKLNAPNFGIIHLAMHGILVEEAPILSSLAFSEDFSDEEDNFLQAYEISQLELNAELVVLSACETGLGKFEQGEGVLSLARSFMYAGVPSLVVSLWQVHDLSTALLMESFYKNLSAGMNKAEALRQAKKTYINGRKGVTAHPAFWSAFIQLGDSSPVQINSKWSWIWWLMGGGFLALAIGGFFLKKKH